MPANAYMKSIDLGLQQDWAKLADVPTVLQATVIADPKNAGNIDVRFRGGPLSKWPPGAAVTFESVDASEIEARGGPNHNVLVVGFAPGDDPRGRTAARLKTVIAQDTAAEPADPGGEIGGGGIG
ncbi:MAG: hypothetical protein HRF50_17535 [Phycisphaerae bacterium]|jgi:hypothetical protein